MISCRLNWSLNMKSAQANMTPRMALLSCFTRKTEIKLNYYRRKLNNINKAHMEFQWFASFWASYGADAPWLSRDIDGISLLLLLTCERNEQKQWIPSILRNGSLIARKTRKHNFKIDWTGSTLFMHLIWRIECTVNKGKWKCFQNDSEGLRNLFGRACVLALF